MRIYYIFYKFKKRDFSEKIDGESIYIRIRTGWNPPATKVAKAPGSSSTNKATKEAYAWVQVMHPQP
jgi:hypothetical protein